MRRLDNAVAEFIIWAATFLLAAVLAYGASYAAWSQPAWPALSLRDAQWGLVAVAAILVVIFRNRLPRMFFAGFAVGLVAFIR